MTTAAPIQPPASPIPYAVLEEEARALLSLSAREIPGLAETISLISAIAPANRVITTGVGKAGFIAMKASATCASLDISSFFLSPQDALHGDLGRVAAGDVILCFSHSGETHELVSLLPYIKDRDASLIAITSSDKSPLAQYASVTVCYGTLNEAPPLRIAPTVSTTVMLALSDAILMAVAEARGVTRDHFYKAHPAGAIGRALVTVEVLMRTDDKHCVVNQDTPLAEVIHAYTTTKGRPGAATIIDNQGKVSGIFTDGDLRRIVDMVPIDLTRPVKAVMGCNPRTVSPQTSAQDALVLMTQHKIDQLIVVNPEGYPLGILDIQDVAPL